MSKVKKRRTYKPHIKGIYDDVWSHIKNADGIVDHFELGYFRGITIAVESLNAKRAVNVIRRRMDDPFDTNLFGNKRDPQYHRGMELAIITIENLE